MGVSSLYTFRYKLLIICAYRWCQTEVPTKVQSSHLCVCIQNVVKNLLVQWGLSGKGTTCKAIVLHNTKLEWGTVWSQVLLTRGFIEGESFTNIGSEGVGLPTLWLGQCIWAGRWRLLVFIMTMMFPFIHRLISTVLCTEAMEGRNCKGHWEIFPSFFPIQAWHWNVFPLLQMEKLLQMNERIGNRSQLPCVSFWSTVYLV